MLKANLTFTHYKYIVAFSVYRGHSFNSRIQLIKKTNAGFLFTYFFIFLQSNAFVIEYSIQEQPKHYKHNRFLFFFELTDCLISVRSTYLFINISLFGAANTWSTCAFSQQIVC